MVEEASLRRVVIFDLDGTLVDAYAAVTASVNYTLEKLGFSPQSSLLIKRAVGGGDRHLMVQFVGEALADQATNIYRPHHSKALMTRVKFLPGAKRLLLDLKKQGFLLAIATNRPTRFTNIILHVLGVHELFDMVLCADKSPKPKPYPDMLLKIVKRLKVAKKDAIYVGDMGIDVKTGKRAGIQTVAVTTGSSTSKELKSLKPRAIIARIIDLKVLINKEKLL